MKPRTVCKKSLAVILAGLMMMGNIGSAGAESSSNSDPSNQQVETAYKSPVRVSLFKYKTKPDKTAQPSALREEATEKEESTQKAENETEKNESVTEKKADNNNTSDQSLNENKSAQEEGTDTEQPAPKSSDSEQPTRGEADNGSVNEETNGTGTEYQTINEYNYYTRGDKKALQFIGGGATVLDETGFNKCINGTAYQGIFADNLVNGALVESPGVHTLPLFSTTNYNSDKTYYYTDEDPYVTGYYNIDTTKLYIKSSDGEYSYDSDKNEAIFDPETGEIAAGGTPTEAGSFFPFENKTGEKFHFGVMTDFNFVVPESEKNNTSDDKYIFEFSADDDLCAYIDGTKVVDVGGIHDAVTAKLNVITGVVEYYNKDGGTAAIIKVNENSNQNVQQEQSSTTGYADGNAHRMQVFYLERGAGKGTLRMKFRPAENTEDISAVKTAKLLSEKDRTYQINIGVAAKPIEHSEKRNSNIVLVLDTSNSMLYRNVMALSGTRKEVFEKLDTLDKSRTYSSEKLNGIGNCCPDTLDSALSKTDKKTLESLLGISYVKNDSKCYGRVKENTTLLRYEGGAWYRYYFNITRGLFGVITNVKLDRRKVKEDDCPTELYTTGMETMKQATKELVDNIDGESNLGIVLFDTKAKALQNIVNVSANRESIKNKVDDITRVGSGATYPSYGLTEAENQFNSGQDILNDKDNHLIFFSDGAAQDYNSTVTVANRMKTNGVTIWGIDAVSEVGGIVRSISSEGKVINVNGIENLSEAFTTALISIEKQKGEIVDYIDDRFELVKSDNTLYKVGDEIVSGNIKGIVVGTGGVVKGIRWSNQELEDLDADGKTKWNVSFKLKAKDSYLGGYSIPTNGSSSCVIVGNSIKQLDMPTVDVPLKAGKFADKDETYLLGTKLKNVWKTVRSLTDQGESKLSDFAVDNDVLAKLTSQINESNTTSTITELYNYGSADDADGVIEYTLETNGTNTCEDHRLDKEGKHVETYKLTTVYKPYSGEERRNKLLDIYSSRLGNYVNFLAPGQTVDASGTYSVNVVPASLEISKVISKADYEKAKKYGDATFTFKILYTPLSDDDESRLNDKTVELYKTVRFTDKENYTLKETEDGEGYIISTSIKNLTKGYYVVSELSTMGYKLDDVKSTGSFAKTNENNKTVEISFKDNNKPLDGNYEDLCRSYSATAKFINSMNHSEKPTDTDAVKNTFDLGGSASSTEIVDNDGENEYRVYLIDIINKANEKVEN
ncbi:VWA domain-containing protein [Lachnobacterium bovis]|uniref:Fibro-slime domain-containing protein n=1 Tax=Lachnobacterium bovis DSM 14045 TaxID=1122142 RepID=A0A1H3GTV9_9FIRM|nr:VWA domain-containing protein [Lachnobacterium bovis]SDY05779.1 fibro-slime domain-containing protein [Lachnobacterium bovis DSM 14045]